jgi:hypothetical protein
MKSVIMVPTAFTISGMAAPHRLTPFQVHVDATAQPDWRRIRHRSVRSTVDKMSEVNQTASSVLQQPQHQLNDDIARKCIGHSQYCHFQSALLIALLIATFVCVGDSRTGSPNALTGPFLLSCALFIYICRPKTVRLGYPAAPVTFFLDLDPRYD